MDLQDNSDSKQEPPGSNRPRRRRPTADVERLARYEEGKTAAIATTTTTTASGSGPPSPSPPPSSRSHTQPCATQTTPASKSGSRNPADLRASGDGQNLNEGNFNPSDRDHGDDGYDTGREGDAAGDGIPMPITMSASVILTKLPRDATAALKQVDELDQGKVTIRFKPVGSAPILKTLVFKISAVSKFETVVNFLRKKLDCRATDSVFLYVNSVFAPGLDEGVGNLFRCFRTDDQLIVAYSMTPAFG